MTSAERASISNGIWLCQTCAKLVDDDPGRYTVDFLREWKASAEAHADAAVLGLPLSANESSSSNGPGAGELMTVSVDGVIYSEINRAVFVPASIWNESDRANSIRSVSLTIEGRSYSASKGRGTIAVGDYSWLSPHGLRVGAWASVRGCWYFGESLLSGSAIHLEPPVRAVLEVVPVRGVGGVLEVTVLAQPTGADASPTAGEPSGDGLEWGAKEMPGRQVQAALARLATRVTLEFHYTVFEDTFGDPLDTIDWTMTRPWLEVFLRIAPKALAGAFRNELKDSLAGMATSSTEWRDYLTALPLGRYGSPEPEGHAFDRLLLVLRGWGLLYLVDSRDGGPMSVWRLTKLADEVQTAVLCGSAKATED